MTEKKNAEIQNYTGFNRKLLVSAGITGAIVLSMLTGFSIYLATTGKVSTQYYHFNIQYKAGQVETYDEIMQSMGHIVYMYGEHSNWKYTIETQFMTLEYMQEHAPAIFHELKRQNIMGQLELIVPQYSNGWYIDSPLRDFKNSVNYTSTRMSEMGLKKSGLVLLQEGQWMPGVVELDGVGDFTAFIIHREQLGYFDYYPDEPVLEWTYNEKTVDVIVSPRLPIHEAGVYHFQSYALDGEIINTGDMELDPSVGEEFVATRFQFNDQKQKNHEEHLEELEDHGVIFMTMEEFYEHCLVKEAVGTMDKYIPECEWVPNQYRQFFNWMGGGSGQVDDGYYRARVYYASNLAKATEVLLNQGHAEGWINSSKYNELGMNRINGTDGQLLEASKLIWEAQVSDATGISPIYLEFLYGMNRTHEAIQICNDILNETRVLSNGTYNGTIQINPWTQTAHNITSNFNNITLVDGGVSLTDIESLFGLTLDITQSENYTKYGYEKDYGKYTFSSASGNTTYYKLNYKFRSLYNINHTHEENEYVHEDNRTQYLTSILNDGRNSIHVIFEDEGAWDKATYSPALMENYTQELTRSDYYSDVDGIDFEFQCLLALSNGMLYNPQEGYAIIRNTTMHNIAASWRVDGIDFYEEDTQYNSEREYYLVKGTLNEVLSFANQINAYQAITLEAL